MTPDQFKEARQLLGLSPLQAAPLLGFTNRSRIYEIEAGNAGVSKPVALLMRAYLDGYRPDGWPA